MPNGAPSTRPEPKSGCTCPLAPMLPTHDAEEPDTGSVDTSACQTLSGGRIEQAAARAEDGGGPDGPDGGGGDGARVVAVAVAPGEDGRPAASVPAVPAGLPEHADS